MRRIAQIRRKHSQPPRGGITFLENVNPSFSSKPLPLVGLYKESPRKTTSTPSAERLLQVFVPMTLTTVQLPGHTIRHVAELSPVQAQILQLLGLPADLYACLTYEIPQTAFPLRK